MGKQGRSIRNGFAASKAYYRMSESRVQHLHIPFLNINDYYNFLAAMMIVLFIVGLVVVFVYEYEALRRSKT